MNRRWGCLRCRDTACRVPTMAAGAVGSWQWAVGRYSMLDTGYWIQDARYWI